MKAALILIHQQSWQTKAHFENRESEVTSCHAAQVFEMPFASYLEEHLNQQRHHYMELYHEAKLYDHTSRRGLVSHYKGH